MTGLLNYRGALDTMDRCQPARAVYRLHLDGGSPKQEERKGGGETPKHFCKRWMPVSFRTNL